MKPIRVAAVALALAVPAAYFALKSAAPAFVARAETALGVPHAPPSFAWPKGQAYRYAIEWRASSEAAVQAEIASAPMRGDAAVRGEMILGAIGDRPGARLVSVRFENVAEHRLAILGKELIPTDDEAKRVFDGREAYVEMGPRGEIGQMYFRKDDPPAWKQVVERIVSELTIALPDHETAEWTVTERAPSGDARSRYRWTDAFALVRDREAYETLTAVPPGVCGADCAQKLQGTSNVRIDPRGYIDALRADETLRLETPRGAVFVGESHADVKLLAVEPLSVATNVDLDMRVLESKTPGQMAVSEDSHRAVLTHLAGGLTPQALDEGLRRYALLGPDAMPDGWLTQAAALLRLDPALCTGLTMLFEEPQIPVSGRAMILDVLAAAGTPEAQRAMREALDSPAASSEPGAYVRLVQRFAFVQHPDLASSEYLARAYENAGDRDAHYASAFALGATLSRLAPADAPAARSMGDRLVRDLKDARSTEDQRALLTALGNAGRAADAPAIARYAKDGSPDVRRAAAAALRKSTAHEARATLVSLVKDADVDVQNEALRSLGEGALTKDAAEELRDIVTSGATSPETDRTVVGLLAAHAGDDGVAGVSRGMLQYILARTQDRRLEARIRMILEGMGPG